MWLPTISFTGEALCEEFHAESLGGLGPFLFRLDWATVDPVEVFPVDRGVVNQDPEGLEALHINRGGLLPLRGGGARAGARPRRTPAPRSMRLRTHD